MSVMSLTPSSRVHFNAIDRQAETSYGERTINGGSERGSCLLCWSFLLVVPCQQQILLWYREPPPTL